MPTLEQERAAFALQKIDSIKEGESRGKFKTQLLKLPARLHNNGLGPTVAFYLSAGKDKPEAVICDWLQVWLGDKREIYPAGKDLIRSISGLGLKQGADPEAKYREASSEARALAVWLKRFAEAFIAGQGEDK
ncbi:MAG TPA: type III-B CRISPR module-associated protein Cmr5 [Thermoanaerobaculia bacterium]